MITDPSDRDIHVMHLLEAFHEEHLATGYHYLSAQTLIEGLDTLYGITPPRQPAITIDQKAQLWK